LLEYLPYLKWVAGTYLLTLQRTSRL
jgi:hypothetical protein